MTRRRRPQRRGGAFVFMFLLVGAGAVFAIALVLDSLMPGGDSRSMCRVDDGEGEVRLSGEQMGNAALIAGVGMDMGASDRAITIALATAMQESSLRNLDHGDRDSLGLFQQRPSQGWGTAEQVQDEVYASHAFYSRLLELPDYADMPLTQAAQAVQISAFPEAYAKHEPLAEALRAAFSGSAPASLTCALDESAGFNSASFLAELERAHPSARASVSGREVVVLSDSDGEAQREQWALAQWAVATAQNTGAGTVRVGDRVWTRADGWQRAQAIISHVAVS